jgi:hypothetical protein
VAARGRRGSTGLRRDVWFHASVWLFRLKPFINWTIFSRSSFVCAHLKYFFLLQLTILAALKLTRANDQNIIFVAEIWEKKLNIINAEIWENNAEIWSFPCASYTYAIEDTRHAHAALKLVALIIKILSCNKKKNISWSNDQNYHNCSTFRV